MPTIINIQDTRAKLDYPRPHALLLSTSNLLTKFIFFASPTSFVHMRHYSQVFLSDSQTRKWDKCKVIGLVRELMWAEALLHPKRSKSELG